MTSLLARWPDSGQYSRTSMNARPSCRYPMYLRTWRDRSRAPVRYVAPLDRGGRSGGESGLERRDVVAARFPVIGARGRADEAAVAFAVHGHEPRTCGTRHGRRLGTRLGARYTSTPGALAHVRGGPGRRWQVGVVLDHDPRRSALVAARRRQQQGDGNEPRGDHVIPTMMATQTATTRTMTTSAAIRPRFSAVPAGARRTPE